MGKRKAGIMGKRRMGKRKAGIMGKRRMGKRRKGGEESQEREGEIGDGVEDTVMGRHRDVKESVEDTVM
jgi:hypothetical protein